MTMPEFVPRVIYDRDYFEGKTRQSPPHTRDLIYPLAKRTAAFLHSRCRPKRVCDIGCAKGYLVEAFQTQGVPTVIGLDISLYAVSQGDATTRGSLMVADVQIGLPIRSASCDLVTALDLLEHLADPRPMLSEIRRVLTDTGVAYVKICHARHPNAHRDPTHVNVQPLAYWKRQFDQAGFGWTRVFESDLTGVQGVVEQIKAQVRRFREWVVIGTPADYKLILRKRYDG